ncbi:uncharacterized protein LOC126903942 [Daktulosphaira vitifoliae]|uniref:uncharacterized protein LOC126903942 n=1 Tax=Daktulosphaira vitifoliae TaxID=58002 RepID=UPI0021AAE257|nr:uncharacterized protein LOC126903942 [Daktulosphaira vitifoliae]
MKIMFLSSHLVSICFIYYILIPIIHSNSNASSSQSPYTENISQTTQSNDDFFYPVDTAWQLKLCEKLEFSFKHKSAMNNKIIPLDVPRVERKIPRKGNCFFDAVSYMITGSTTYGVRLRNHVLDYMESQTTSLTDENSHLERITIMRNPETYAEFDEIYATAAFLETSFYVFSEENVKKWLFISREGLDGKRIKEPCIYLYLNGLEDNAHYTVVIDVKHNELFKRHFIPVSPDWQDMKTKDFMPPGKNVKKYLFKTQIKNFLFKNVSEDRISNDYNCSFYKSISYLIIGDKEFYKNIRDCIYESMYESKSITMLLKNRESRNNYIEILKRYKQDADTPEIFATAELLNTSIYIYHTEERDWDFVSKNGPEGVEEIEPCIYLAYGGCDRKLYSVVYNVSKQEYKPEKLESLFEKFLKKINVLE